MQHEYTYIRINVDYSPVHSQLFNVSVCKIQKLGTKLERHNTRMVATTIVVPRASPFNAACILYMYMYMYCACIIHFYIACMCAMGEVIIFVAVHIKTVRS